MDKLFLKEFAYQYILLHDNLTKDEKLQLGGFVKEASDEQVMSMLLTGECKEKLEEGEGKYVKVLFEAGPASKLFKELDVKLLGYTPSAGWVKKLATMWADYKVGPGKFEDLGILKLRIPDENYGAWRLAYKQAGHAIETGAPVAALVMAALITLVATKIYKSYLSKAAKACKGQATSELKKQCMKKFAITALEAKIRMLQGSIRACDTTKNPGKCKQKVTGKIESSRKKLIKMKSK